MSDPESGHLTPMFEITTYESGFNQVGLRDSYLLEARLEGPDY